MKHGKVNKSVFRGFFLNQILGKRRFLSYVFNFYAEESRLIPDELHWVFDLRWSSWNKRQNSGFGVLAVGFAGDSLQDFRRWITYTVFERGLAICVQKKMLPKVERRAEGSERDRERPRASENQATVQVASKKCYCSAYVSVPATHRRESPSMWLERTRSQSSDLNLGSFFNTCFIRIPDDCGVSARSHYIVFISEVEEVGIELKTWISSCYLG